MQNNYWNRLIVALDLTDEKKVREVIEKLSPKVKIFKVGLIPYTKFGNKIFSWISQAQAKVFIDLKIFDIPHTMVETAKLFVEANAWGFTIHTRCGQEALKQVKQAVDNHAKLNKISAPLVIGVTQLTSDEACWQDVAKLADAAKTAGLEAVVCSVWEAKQIKQEFNLLTVTPGIRCKKADDDQKRVATVQQAIENQADFWVVGRPIVEANDYLAAAQNLFI